MCVYKLLFKISYDKHVYSMWKHFRELHGMLATKKICFWRFDKNNYHCAVHGPKIIVSGANQWLN